MELRNCIEFVVTKGERTYCFHAPAGSPLGEIDDAAFEILGEITARAQEAVTKAAPKEVSDNPKGD